MTKEKSDELTKQGELEQLREIEHVYQTSSYYSGYLTHWRIDAEDPNFMKLIAGLKVEVEHLEETHASAAKTLQETQDTLKEEQNKLNEKLQELRNKIQQHQGKLD